MDIEIRGQLLHPLDHDIGTAAFHPAVIRLNGCQPVHAATQHDHDEVLFLHLCCTGVEQR